MKNPVCELITHFQLGGQRSEEPLCSVNGLAPIIPLKYFPPCSFYFRIQPSF